MIPFLPAADDEALFSVIARTARFLGVSAASTYLTPRSLNCRVDGLIPLGENISAIASHWGISCREIYDRHSLLPYYGFAVSDAAYENAVCSLQSSSNKMALRNDAFGWTLGARGLERRFCKKCADDDRKSVGFSFWRRQHLLPNVCFCVRHGSVLYKTHDEHRFGDDRMPLELESSYPVWSGGSDVERGRALGIARTSCFLLRRDKCLTRGEMVNNLVNWIHFGSPASLEKVSELKTKWDAVFSQLPVSNNVTDRILKRALRLIGGKGPMLTASDYCLWSAASSETGNTVQVYDGRNIVCPFTGLIDAVPHRGCFYALERQSYLGLSHAVSCGCGLRYSFRFTRATRPSVPVVDRWLRPTGLAARRLRERLKESEMEILKKFTISDDVAESIRTSSSELIEFELLIAGWRRKNGHDRERVEGSFPQEMEGVAITKVA